MEGGYNGHRALSVCACVRVVFSFAAVSLGERGYVKKIVPVSFLRWHERSSGSRSVCVMVRNGWERGFESMDCSICGLVDKEIVSRREQ